MMLSAKADAPCSLRARPPAMLHWPQAAGSRRLTRGKSCSWHAMQGSSQMLYKEQEQGPLCLLSTSCIPCTIPMCYRVSTPHQSPQSSILASSSSSTSCAEHRPTFDEVVEELATLLQGARENKEGLDGGSPVKQTDSAAPQQQAVFRNAGVADSVCLISSPAERSPMPGMAKFLRRVKEH